MAGIGYGGGRGRGSRAMGIQFVKSSDTLHSDTPSSANGSAPPHDSGRPGLLGPRPLSSPQNSSFAGASQRNNYNRQPARGSSALGMGPNPSEVFRFGQTFVKSGENSPSPHKPAGTSAHRNDYKMPGSVNLSKGASKSAPASANFSRTPEARPVLSKDEYYSLWKNEKDPLLQKFRKLAYEVVSLKTDRPNAKDKLHSAANRVPIRIEFNTEPVFGGKSSSSFLCYVFLEGITVASGSALKIKDSKTNAYEAALQKLLMPHMRVVKLDPESSELQVSKTSFISPPPEPSRTVLKKSCAKLPPSAQSTSQTAKSAAEIQSQHKESNLEAACLKRRFNEYKSLEEFVIVEPRIPIPDCTPAHTLRRSADFNHMLLEYEYFFRGEAARCVLKIENQVLADVNGVSKVAAKNAASAHALRKLKNICWVIKTKKAVDSDTKISKEDMINELSEQSECISNDNIGNKLLRKMGWAGGGVGKDGSGIAEPVELKSVLNREGLGLSAQRGITDDFKKRVREVIENYASSENQEDLVFACDFRLDERQIIHDECRRLNLRSKSRGKGQQRYLCVRRKRSANQLFQHIMSCGGETARYVLVPPGSDVNGPVMSPTANPTGVRAQGRHGTDSYKDKQTAAGQAKPLMGLILNGPQPSSQGCVPRNGPTFQNRSVGLESNGMLGNSDGHVESGRGNHTGSGMCDGQNRGSQGNGGRNVASNAVPRTMAQNCGNSCGYGVQNNPTMGNNQMGMQGMGNNWMGMQNMGNYQNGVQNMGNNHAGLGMQNVGSNGTGAQGMGCNEVGMPNVRNNQMGMQNMGNNQPWMPNVGNNQMGVQTFRNNQIGMQNLGHCQMGMQNMGTNQMGMQGAGMGSNAFVMQAMVNGGTGHQQAGPDVQWGCGAGQFGVPGSSGWQPEQGIGGGWRGLSSGGYGQKMGSQGMPQGPPGRISSYR